MLFRWEWGCFQLTKVYPVATRLQDFWNIFYVSDDIMSSVNKITSHYTVPRIWKKVNDKYSINISSNQGCCTTGWKNKCKTFFLELICVMQNIFPSLHNTQIYLARFKSCPSLWTRLVITITDFSFRPADVPRMTGNKHILHTSCYKSLAWFVVLQGVPWWYSWGCCSGDEMDSMAQSRTRGLGQDMRCDVVLMLCSWKILKEILSVIHVCRDRGRRNLEWACNSPCR